MRDSAVIAVAALMLTGTRITADTAIYRCVLEDGTTGFQETPCPELATNVDTGNEPSESHSDSGTPPAADSFDFVNPFDESANPPTHPEPTLPKPVSQDRTECEKITRDAIDAIDLEMRGKSYTKNEGEQYLAELLVLTRQLRACKRL